MLAISGVANIMAMCLQKISPGLYLPGGKHKVLKSRKICKPQCTRAFQASSSITLVNVILAITSHMIKTSVNGKDIDSLS